MERMATDGAHCPFLVPFAPSPHPQTQYLCPPFSPLPSPSSSSTNWLWSVSRGTHVVSYAGIRLKGATLRVCHPALFSPHSTPVESTTWTTHRPSQVSLLEMPLSVPLPRLILGYGRRASHWPCAHNAEDQQRIHRRWAAPYQAGWEAGWPIRAWNGARGHITAPFHIMGCGGLLMRPGPGLLLICPVSYWRGSQPVELYEILSNSQ